MAQVSIFTIELYFSTAQISFSFIEVCFSIGELCTSTLQVRPYFSKGTCMHLRPKISGVEFAFLSMWRIGCSLNYTFRRTGGLQCIYRHTVLLIFPLQVYDNLLCWRTPEELLAHFLHEFYMEYTTVFLRYHHNQGSFLNCLFFICMHKSSSPSFDAILCLLQLLNDTKTLQTLSFT